MHFNLPEIHFPQQTIQLLLVAPVAIQHQRDDAEQQQCTARNARRDFARVACQHMCDGGTYGIEMVVMRMMMMVVDDNDNDNDNGAKIEGWIECECDGYIEYSSNVVCCVCILGKRP